MRIVPSDAIDGPVSRSQIGNVSTADSEMLNITPGQLRINLVQNKLT